MITREDITLLTELQELGMTFIVILVLGGFTLYTLRKTEKNHIESLEKIENLEVKYQEEHDNKAKCEQNLAVLTQKLDTASKTLEKCLEKIVRYSIPQNHKGG